MIISNFHKNGEICRVSPFLCLIDIFDYFIVSRFIFSLILFWVEFCAG